jgi:L-ascorbate metabolism protein UlaG (beta-lactamase superfamily)
MPSLRALLKLFPKLELMVPQGDKGWLQAAGFPAVHEFTWWQEHGPFTFLPARHWSQNGVFDCNKSLWGSWMIRHGNHSIYFAGDTAYSNHFSAIASEFNNITVALMPIGPCEPDPAMRKSHVDSAQAVQGFIDLQAHHFVPMHWGTFPFGTDHFATPIERLQAAWQKHGTALDGKKLCITKFGMPLMF